MAQFPCFDAPPELVRRRIEVTQFDAVTKAASRCSHLVTFNSRPEPEVDDDAQAEGQDPLGQAPEFLFDLLAGRSVPWAGANGPQPLVLRETHGEPLCNELQCKGGLPAPGNPQVRINRASPMAGHSSSSASWVSLPLIREHAGAWPNIASFDRPSVYVQRLG